MNTSNSMVSGNDMFSFMSGANPDIVANPFELLAQVRSMSAIVPLPFPLGDGNRQVWMVTRMAEVVQVLKENEHFTVDPSSIGLTGLFGGNRGEDADAATFFTSKSMLTVDEPDHRRLRQLVAKAFTPRYVDGLRGSVQQIAEKLIDRVQEQGHMDVVKDYAFPLPINVISNMLGIPESDWEQLRGWSEALAKGLGVGGPDPEVAANLRAFGEYTARLVSEKRQHPSDDLISQMIAMEEAGDRLSETELLSTITLLIFAGHETTSNLIATGTLMLLDYPDQLAKLKSDFSLAPSAVEELLRFNGPATIAGPRYAKQDIELGGQQVKRGDIVFPVVLSANRDERQFTQPEDLEIVRALNRHIAFGQGIHICLGAPLARLEGDIAFTTLFKRLPDLHLAIPREDIKWHFSLNSRSLDALPVAF